jgi:hypothetical protein
MHTKVEPLKSKLVALKKALEKTQEGLDEAIDVCETLSIKRNKLFEIFEDPSIAIPKSLAID